MKLFHQISLFLLTIIFLFITFIMGIHAFGLLPESYLPLLVEYTYKNLEIGLISAILFLAGVWLLQSFLSKEYEAQSIVQKNEMGEVKISLSAIKGLVEQMVMNQSGIKNVKTKFQILDEGFIIDLYLIVKSDVYVPTLSKELGNLVKEHLLEMVGLEITEVKIIIDEIVTEKKGSNSTVRVR